MLLNKTIRLFLDSIGRREEYEFYLNKFQSAGTACFALLVPDLESLEQGAEALAFDLKFLLKLGLRPAVVLCGSDAAAKWALLKDNSLFELIAFPSIGKRKAGIPVFVEENLQCLESLLPKIPHSTGSGQATIGVAKRVHFIRAAGGLSSEYVYVQKPSDDLQPEDRPLVETAAALLEARPGTHISVTSPINLLKEIFTVKGAGTVFRRGSVICSKKADSQKLLELLEESFKRKPKRGVLKDVTQIYFEENYRGAALLEQQPEGLYLSKFAVGPEARGEGLAQELWDEVCKNHPAFFWRSRKGNPVNQWYDRHADGRHTPGDWVVFWRGMDADAIPGLIAFCVLRKPDFKSP
jgi:ribosomal protein S18 acetylase RimI-like enzyme